MKITQYCSVCKQSLEMEVVPTSDGEDDGVLWLRCPQCLGFLPKISGAGLKPVAGSTAEDTATVDTSTPGDDTADGADSPANTDEGSPSSADAGSLAVIVPATDGANLSEGTELPEVSGHVEDGDGDSAAAASGAKGKDKPVEPAEPLAEYAAMLAERDPQSAIPYRPWSEYQIGDLIHHLAWDDCGVVVAKETLPGNRRVAKVYFDRTGVVRLIEADPSQA